MAKRVYQLDLAYFQLGALRVPTRKFSVFTYGWDVTQLHWQSTSPWPGVGAPYPDDTYQWVFERYCLRRPLQLLAVERWSRKVVLRLWGVRHVSWRPQSGGLTGTCEALEQLHLPPSPSVARPLDVWPTIPSELA